MTEPAYLAAVRESYDTVAADYVKRIPPPAEMDPLGRAMLAAFAELVRVNDRGPVADLVCVPGRVTAYLTSQGVSAFGIDLSPKMIALARDTHPDLRFTVGSMTALDLDDDSLGGVLVLFSTYHTPPDQLPMVFAEFNRALAPGGHLLLGTYVGDDEHLRPTQAYGGYPVSYQAYLIPANRIAALLSQAGLIVTARLSQEPDGTAKRPHALLLARKPEQP